MLLVLLDYFLQSSPIEIENILRPPFTVNKTIDYTNCKCIADSRNDACHLYHYITPPFEGCTPLFEKRSLMSTTRMVVEIYIYTVIHKREMLLIFYVQHAGSMLDIIPYPESSMGPP